MGIYHANVATPESKGTSAQWNAAHTIDDDSKPKNSTTLIVAAHDSFDTTRADYVCDGVDDQDEINAAITALGGQGGQITLLEGSYILAASIITTNYVTIRGQGYSTLLQTTANIRMVSIASDNYVIVQDVRIYGAGNGNNSNTGVYVAASDNVTLHNIIATNCGARGIDITTTADNLIITECYCVSNFLHGIHLHGTSTNTLFFGNHCRLNAGCGIYVQSSSEGVYLGNICEDNVNYGILLSGCTDNVISSNVAVGNDSGATGNYDGIAIISGSDDNTITGNRCKDNGGWGINIASADCDRNIVVANQLHNGGTTGNYNDSGTNTEAAHNIVA